MVFEQIRPESLEVRNALVHGQLLRFSVKLPQISAGQFVVMKFNVLLDNKNVHAYEFLYISKEMMTDLKGMGVFTKKFRFIQQ